MNDIAYILNGSDARRVVYAAAGLRLEDLRSNEATLCEVEDVEWKIRWDGGTQVTFYHDTDKGVLDPFICSSVFRLEDPGGRGTLTVRGSPVHPPFRLVEASEGSSLITVEDRHAFPIGRRPHVAIFPAGGWYRGGNQDILAQVFQQFAHIISFCIFVLTAAKRHYSY